MLLLLGDDFNLTVEIVNGSLQLLLTLPAVIPEPLQLIIRFIDEEGSGDPVELMTADEHYGGTWIMYEVSEDVVPFSQFRLRVALAVGNITGPFVPPLGDEVFGKTVCVSTCFLITQTC